ncbi:response regulator [Mesonia sediminis]|uniref:Response regulator n=1 Tax=Mesonia sediminis TaxID=1703946 RepID=A0ABW5S9V1_9FLAO
MLSNRAKPLNVLVIEDNLGDYILLEDYLLEKNKGIQIEHAQNLSQAQDILNFKLEINLIFLDLILPDASGIELVQACLKMADKTPIIILTGYSDLHWAKRSLQLGVYDFLVKDELNPNLLGKSMAFTLNRHFFIQQVERERQNFARLFNLSPQPMWLLEPQKLAITHANQAACELYPDKSKVFNNLSFLELFGEEDRISIQELIQMKNTSRGQHYFEQPNTLEGNIQVELHFTRVPDMDAGEAILIQANNVTRTLDYIQTIERQNAKLRKIAWDQSHRLRAPLARIMSIVNLIQAHPESVEDLVSWLNELKYSSEEMDAVLKQLVNETKEG